MLGSADESADANRQQHHTHHHYLNACQMLPFGIAIDIQMNGKNNYFIKEFAAYAEDYNVHFFLNCPPQRDNYEEHHNRAIENINGIPQNYNGYPNAHLRWILGSIINRYKVIYVFGANKKAALLNYIRRNSGGVNIDINIVNCQHTLDNKVALNYLTDSNQIKFYNICDLNNPIHIKRCAARKAVDLYYNLNQNKNQYEQ